MTDGSKPVSEFTQCSECGRALARNEQPEGPELRALAVYCSQTCSDVSAEREGGWVKVADMTPEQRAELDHLLTPSWKKGAPS